MIENVDINPAIDVDNNQRTSLKGCALSCSKWLSHLITPFTFIMNHLTACVEVLNIINLFIAYKMKGDH